ARPAFGDRGLGAVAGGLVVAAVADLLGRVLLADEAVVEVVRVLVAVAVAELGRAGVVGVAQVRGDLADEAAPHVADGGADGLHHGVGLGRQRAVDDRLGEVDLAFGQADELDGLGGGDGGLQAGGVGHADVLG